MRVANYVLFSGTNVAAPFNSDVMDMEQQIGLSVQVDWTSTTASATLTLQVSNNGTSWANLASTVTINNNSGTAMLYATDFHYKFARVAVTPLTGSITSLTLHVTEKGL